MPFDSSIPFSSSQPKIVATICNSADWAMAEKIIPLSVDSPHFLEVRADLLLENAADLPGNISELPLPVLLTVRHPSEGGKSPLDAKERSDIYRRYWKQAAAIDIELASISDLSNLIAEAISMELPCIFSHHDFASTPSLAALQGMTRRAAESGAALFKAATTTNTAAELSTLLTFVETESFPLAAMGMGTLGKISRPLLAQLGSRLNYGYLSAPVVSGQWPASELQRVIQSLP